MGVRQPFWVGHWSGAVGRPWIWPVFLTGMLVSCGPAAPRHPARTAAPCSAAVRDSQASRMSALGASARAAGARGDLSALRALSDSVDALRRASLLRCPDDTIAKS